MQKIIELIKPKKVEFHIFGMHRKSIENVLARNGLYMQVVFAIILLLIKLTTLIET